MPKYLDIASAIEARVRHGDYRLRGFPSHAGLVTELGVNSRTVAKALSSLIEQGVLVRQESGRIDVREDHAVEVLHIGVLSPAWVSSNIMKWHELVYQAVQGRGWVAKPVVYSHWHDMAITEALRGLDGLFFISVGGDLPRPIVEQIHGTDTPVVVLEQDVSAQNIPCLRYWNPAAIDQLIRHLHGAGYRRVACLNTQPSDKVIHERIAAWRRWSSAHGVRGTLIDAPCVRGEDAMVHAHQVTRDLIRRGKLDATALLCTTGHVAVGAMRGAIDSGLHPGSDIGICSIEEWADVARMLSPSLTCLTPPPIGPLLQVCLDYFGQSEKEWLGPLLVEPPTMELFIGESTMQNPSADDVDRAEQRHRRHYDRSATTTGTSLDRMT